MKIALLYYTAWPYIGGIENFLRDQASMLAGQRDEVTVITGDGKDLGQDYQFLIVPEISHNFPLNLEVKSVLNRGQMDQKFNQYRSLLVETLRSCLAPFDLVIVHNIFTMHLNLALTQALHDLAAEFKFIAWTNDLVATNSDYSLPNPTKSPWNLMRTAHPGVTYVATSKIRREEMRKHLVSVPEVTVVPDVIDLGRHFNLTAEMEASLEALNLIDRDYVFLLPAARLSPRKNIEFAIEVIKEIHVSGFRPLLLITGGGDSQNSSSLQYGEYLRGCIPPHLKRNIVFVQDHFPVLDATMRDLYALADCLFFPSRQEGFGMPVIEAALHRLPIWCNEVPAFWELEGQGMFLFTEISQLPAALEWLESIPSFRLQRSVRRSFDSNEIYKKNYLPLFAALVSA